MALSWDPTAKTVPSGENFISDILSVESFYLKKKYKLIIIYY